MVIPRLPVVTRLVQDEMPEVTPTSPFVLGVEHTAADVAPERAPFRHQQAWNTGLANDYHPRASHDEL